MRRKIDRYWISKHGVKSLYFRLTLFVAFLSVISGTVCAKKVLVLGIDGMDPKLLQKFVNEAKMPNFESLIAQGDFKPLQTSIPPQSPVAWSTFITGMDPGGHGIFDFIHRDPETMNFFLSMSQAMPPEKTIRVGSWVIPLSEGKIEQLRKGTAFWQVLEEHGVPTTIYKIPANFPPVPSSGKSLSGMGTPDIRGNPGEFSLYTTDVPSQARRITRSVYSVPGGNIYKVEPEDYRIGAQLVGPSNSFRLVSKGSRSRRERVEHPDCTIDFNVYLDPEKPVAKIVVQDDQFILNEGEWSDWIRVDFEAVPYMVSISAIGRFYLQQVRPEFRLYVSPLQINPEDPAMPISTPDDWSHDLYEKLGYFYTQMLPEDTKALQEGIFTGREFWEQAQFVYRERRKALEYFLSEFQDGLLFFYFSSLDQGSHMLWRYMDPKHPGYDPEATLLQKGIETIYREMDDSLGYVLDTIDNDTVLIIMSDHGFCPFYWGVNLNSWLLEKGYLKLRYAAHRGRSEFFQNVDWDRTQAYALGLNGLYVNLKGREKNGIVSPGAEYEDLLNRLEKDLLEMEDPVRKRHPVSQVTQTHRDFHGPYIENAPDIIVGYNWGYRCSWESPLGSFPEELYPENSDPWSGDHCMDSRIIPGVLVTNQRITLDQPALYDLTVAVLDEFGVSPLPGMIGRDCIGPIGATEMEPAEEPMPEDRRKSLESLGYVE